MTDISTLQRTLRSSKMGVSGLSCCLYFYCLTKNCQKRRGLWWGTTEKKETVRRIKRPCAINLSKLLPEDKHFKTFNGTKNRCRTSINIVYTPCTSTQNRFLLIRVFSLGQRFNKWVRHGIQFHRDNSCKLISSFLDPLFFSKCSSEVSYCLLECLCSWLRLTPTHSEHPQPSSFPLWFRWSLWPILLARSKAASGTSFLF